MIMKKLIWVLLILSVVQSVYSSTSARPKDNKRTSKSSSRTSSRNSTSKSRNSTTNPDGSSDNEEASTAFCEAMMSKNKKTKENEDECKNRINEYLGPNSEFNRDSENAKKLGGLCKQIELEGNCFRFLFFLKKFEGWNLKTSIEFFESLVDSYTLEEMSDINKIDMDSISYFLPYNDWQTLNAMDGIKLATILEVLENEGRIVDILKTFSDYYNTNGQRRTVCSAQEIVYFHTFFNTETSGYNGHSNKYSEEPWMSIEKICLLNSSKKCYWNGQILKVIFQHKEELKGREERQTFFENACSLNLQNWVTKYPTKNQWRLGNFLKFLRKIKDPQFLTLKALDAAAKKEVDPTMLTGFFEYLPKDVSSTESSLSALADEVIYGAKFEKQTTYLRALRNLVKRTGRDLYSTYKYGIETLKRVYNKENNQDRFDAVILAGDLEDVDIYDVARTGLTKVKQEREDFTLKSRKDIQERIETLLEERKKIINADDSGLAVAISDDLSVDADIDKTQDDMWHYTVWDKQSELKESQNEHEKLMEEKFEFKKLVLKKTEKERRRRSVINSQYFNRILELQRILKNEDSETDTFQVPSWLFIPSASQGTKIREQP